MPVPKEALKKINEFLWEIPQDYRQDMRVPARIYALEKMLEEISRDRSLDQLVNVSTLPGIQKYALVMPDVHEGYGFPIGGVAAMDLEEGIISPGGIGYDINCGVRLLSSELKFGEISSYLDDLAKAFYLEVPSGVGRGGRLNLNPARLDEVLKKGARWMVEHGYGEEDDLLYIESYGELGDADPDKVSLHAKKRGRDQLGTMGAGNHFVEIDRIEEIFRDEEGNTPAEKLGLFKDQVVILIHTGSRGLGHQVATDYIRKMMKVMPKYGIVLPDRELACSPYKSSEGRDYFLAMCAAANFAWANRQLITYEVREAWQKILGSGGGELKIVYDVAHNIAKIEEYEIDGKKKKLLIHRKGATRAFAPGQEEIASFYQEVGQPVLIPGSMGTNSYVLLGTEGAMRETFGSSCHGAGRRMSRQKAKREIHGRELKKQLEEEGIHIQAGSWSGLAEEAPFAYKDVSAVVETVHRAGIARKVAKLRPIAVIKG